MTAWGDMNQEMTPLPLDAETAERLLAGRVAVEDAPPGYGPVLRLLDAASADASAEELRRESEAVAAFAHAVRSSRASSWSTRASMPFGLTRARLVALAIVAGLATATGVAAAGSLPGAAQDIASRVLEKLGISVPGANEHSGTRADDRGGSARTSGALSRPGSSGTTFHVAGAIAAVRFADGTAGQGPAGTGARRLGRRGVGETSADGDGATEDRTRSRRRMPPAARRTRSARSRPATKQARLRDRDGARAPAVKEARPGPAAQDNRYDRKEVKRPSTRDDAARRDSPPAPGSGAPPGGAPGPPSGGASSTTPRRLRSHLPRAAVRGARRTHPRRRRHAGPDEQPRPRAARPDRIQRGSHRERHPAQGAGKS